MWVFASLTHLSWLFCPHHMEVRIPRGWLLASAVSVLEPRPEPTEQPHPQHLFPQLLWPLWFIFFFTSEPFDKHISKPGLNPIVFKFFFLPLFLFPPLP